MLRTNVLFQLAQLTKEFTRFKQVKYQMSDLAVCQGSTHEQGEGQAS